jgi:hypothetical protein
MYPQLNSRERAAGAFQTISATVAGLIHKALLVSTSSLSLHFPKCGPCVMSMGKLSLAKMQDPESSSCLVAIGGPGCWYVANTMQLVDLFVVYQALGIVIPHDNRHSPQQNLFFRSGLTTVHFNAIENATSPMIYV